MFHIEDGREHFYQWDLNRRIVVEDSSITEVHFCNRTSDCSLIAEVIDGVVNVPNILLTTDYNINVYGYDKEYTKHSAVFKVIARSKPDDYIYTDEEIKQWEQINEDLQNTKQRVAELEEFTAYECKENMSAINATLTKVEKKYLLWENSSIMSTFSAQDIYKSYEEKKYPKFTKFEIEFFYHNASNNGLRMSAPAVAYVGIGDSVGSLTYACENEIVRRNFAIKNNGKELIWGVGDCWFYTFTFYNAGRYYLPTGAKGESATYCIPYRIYGIAEVEK